MLDFQYCGGCSVLWRLFSTLEVVQCCGGFSVLWRLFSAVKDFQNFGSRCVPLNEQKGFQEQKSIKKFSENLFRLFGSLTKITPH